MGKEKPGVQECVQLSPSTMNAKDRHTLSWQLGCLGILVEDKAAQRYLVALMGLW